DDCARSQGDAHKPPGPRPFHDGRDGHQCARHGLSDGRDSAAAAARPEVTLSDRRGGNPPDLSGRRGKTAVDAPRRTEIVRGVVPPARREDGASWSGIPCCESRAGRSTTRPTASTERPGTSASATAGSLLTSRAGVRSTQRGWWSFPAAWTSTPTSPAL